MLGFPANITNKMCCFIGYISTMKISHSYGCSQPVTLVSESLVTRRLRRLRSNLLRFYNNLRIWHLKTHWTPWTSYRLTIVWNVPDCHILLYTTHFYRHTNISPNLMEQPLWFPPEGLPLPRRIRLLLIKLQRLGHNPLSDFSFYLSNSFCALTKIYTCDHHHVWFECSQFSCSSK